MSESVIEPGTEELVSAVTGWLALPDVAERLGAELRKVRQLLRERQLLAVRRDGVLYVPEVFVAGGRVLKGLPGTLTLLGDAGFSDEEALVWLCTEDEVLAASPIAALVAGRSTVVKRHAQLVL